MFISQGAAHRDVSSWRIIPKNSRLLMCQSLDQFFRSTLTHAIRFSGATHFLEVKKLPGLLDILIPGNYAFMVVYYS